HQEPAVRLLVLAKHEVRIRKTLDLPRHQTRPALAAIAVAAAVVHRQARIQRALQQALVRVVLDAPARGADFDGVGHGGGVSGAGGVASNGGSRMPDPNKQGQSTQAAGGLSKPPRLTGNEGAHYIFLTYQ